MSALRTALLISTLLLAAPAAAVIIDVGDGTGNTGPPPDDPGWDHVGVRGGTTAVYIRNGWVLTAYHVITGDVVLGGVAYDAIPGTEVRLEGNGKLADLKLYGITPEPDLPELPIRASTALPTGTVILIGNGRDRGAATDSNDPTVWEPPPDPPDPPIQGYLWGTSKTLRWGSNTVVGTWPFPSNTVAFYTVFDEPTSVDRTSDESQAANGDSGGALFAKEGSTWELAGILFTIAGEEGQIAGALYGNATGAADLSFYRDDIMNVTAVPEPGRGLMLGTGLAFLAGLGRRRVRPSCRRGRGQRRRPRRSAASISWLDRRDTSAPVNIDEP